MCNAMASVAYDEMKQWTVDDVLAWLQKNNFTEFQEFVSFERICGDDFLKLDRGRLSNCSVSKSKKDSLLKRLKDIEKERTKMLKNMKKNQNSSNTRQIPPVKAHPSVLGRTAPPPPKPEDDAEDDFDDDDEWEEEQGVYDNDDQVIQPTKGHRSDPPPPIPQSQTPNDGDSDEDYEKPENPGPTSRAPPPIPNDDDDLYEKANQAKIPGRTIPQPMNYAAPPQRPVPPAQAQGPSVPPPRGGRAPIATPTSRPILYEISSPPPPRNSSPPPPIPRPSVPAGPKAPAVLEYESVKDLKANMTTDECDEPPPPKPEKIQIAEINPFGAPEPPKRRQEPPGPPGGPPEAFASHAVVVSPVTYTSDIKKQPWYFGDCGRDTANQILLESAKEGTYLVRDSKGGGQPYTLGIFYKGNTSNIAIRKRPDGKFSLGTEKPDEHVFETINDMITFHRCNDIEVFKGGNMAGRVKLVKVAEKSIYLSTSPRF